MFRASIRPLATVLLAVSVASCADAPSATPSRTNGNRGLARIGFQPVFSVSARNAAAHLADFGISFDHVHVVIVRPPSEVVADTTIAFGPNQQDATLDLTVAVHADGEIFNASIDYTNPQGIVFHGQGTVQSHPADAAAPPQDIGVQYVGPGASVTRITISPKTSAVVAPSTVNFTVSGFDANNAPVTGVIPVGWTSSDPTVATISSAGVLTPAGKRGTVTVTATTPTAATDNATVRVSLGASGIVLVSGGGQIAKVGSALSAPAVVQVIASDGLGVPGIAVSFGAPAGGSVSATTALTDDAGKASVSMTLGGLVGTQRFTAASGSFNVAISATALVGDPANIGVASGSGQLDTVAHALKLPLVARVADKFDNPVPKVTVNWARSGGSGVLGGTTSVTDDNGQASIAYTLGNLVGSDTIIASTSGVSSSATFTVRGVAGAPASIAALSGNQQSARILQVLSPFVIKVIDAASNPIVGATVSWTAVNGTLTSATTVTDATGQSTNTMTLGSIAGAANATATVGTQSVKFTAVAQPGVVSKLGFVSLPVTNLASGLITPPVRVALLDGAGNITTATDPVTIALGTNPRGGTLFGTLTRNAVAGIATFSDLLIDSVATGYTFTAASPSTGSWISAKFTVTPNLLDFGPKSVDGVFSTVPFFFTEGFGFVVGGTTVNFTGVQATVTNIAAQGQSLSGTLNIPGGVTGGIGTISVSTPFGTSNTMPVEIASVGNATLQLGPANGGGGGSPYSIDCPAGSVATGLNARGGVNVDQIQLICQAVTGAARTFQSPTFTATVGGSGGSPGTISCPANNVLVGLAGLVGAGGGPFNDQIDAVCEPIAGGTPTATNTPVGGNNSGSISYFVTCPTGLAVTGIQGGAGNLVDRTQIKCR